MVLGLCRQGSKLPTHSLPPKGALARAQARSRNRIQHSAICVRRLPTNQLVQSRVSGVDNWETHAPKDQMLRQREPAPAWRASRQISAAGSNAPVFTLPAWMQTRVILSSGGSASDRILPWLSTGTL